MALQLDYAVARPHAVAFVTKHITRVVTAAALVSTMALTPIYPVSAQQEGGRAWLDAERQPPAYQRAVLYLLPDVGRLRAMHIAPHVSHLVYLGAAPRGGALFVLARPSVLAPGTPFGAELHDAGFELHSHDGLVDRRVEFEELRAFTTVFETEIGTIDVVFAALRDVELSSDFHALTLDSYPSPATELRLVNYWPEVADADDFILRWRVCRAGALNTRLQIAAHNCLSPLTTHSFGAPVFNQETHAPRVVGFYLWFDEAERDAKAVTFGQEVINYASTALIVGGNKRVAGFWGELKNNRH